MKKLILALIMLVGSSEVALANLIQNGSFEDYSFASGVTAYVLDGTCSESNCIELNNSDPWQPYLGSPNDFLELRNTALITGVGTEVTAPLPGNGTNYAELNFITSNQVSGIQQSFTAQAGIAQLDWFDHARGETSYQIFINDILVDTRNATDYFSWTQHSLNVNLIAGTNTIAFVENAAGHVVTNLDEISITQSVAAVPEPQTYSMLLMGVALISLVRRKNKIN